RFCWFKLGRALKPQPAHTARSHTVSVDHATNSQMRGLAELRNPNGLRGGRACRSLSLFAGLGYHLIVEHMAIVVLVNTELAEIMVVELHPLRARINI